MRYRFHFRNVFEIDRNEFDEKFKDFFDVEFSMLNIDQHTKCYHEKIFNQKVEFRILKVIDNLLRLEQKHMIFEHDDEQLENQRNEKTRFIINYSDDFQNRFEFCHFFHNYQFFFEYNDFFFRRDRLRRILHDNILENEKKIFFFSHRQRQNFRSQRCV